MPLQIDRLARFEREAKALVSLNHPHIARIIDGGKRSESDIRIVGRPKR